MIKFFPHRIDPELLPPHPDEEDEENRRVNTAAARREAQVRREVWAEARSWLVLAFALGMLAGVIVALWALGGL